MILEHVVGYELAFLIMSNSGVLGNCNFTRKLDG